MDTVAPAVYVPPLIPECADERLSSQANPEEAQDFQPDTTSYWTSDVLQSTVPGLVLGAIAVVCMCGLILWATIAFCTCCSVSKRRRKGEVGDQNMEDPFRNDDRDAMMAPEVTYSDRYSVLENGRDLRSPSGMAPRLKSNREPSGQRTDDINAQFGLPRDLTCVERFRLRKVLCASIVVMAAATVGVSSWGIYVSVESTAHAVPEFWNVFGQVQDIADQALGLLSRLDSVVTETEVNLSTVIESKGEIQSLASIPGIQQTFGLANPLSQVVDELDQVMTVLRDIKQPIQEAANVSNGTFISGFSEFREDFEPPTFAFQDTWRFVAIGVCFGLLILFVLLSSALTVWARFPRLGSTCTILLWAMVAVLMFLGAGVMSGVKYVTEDGCLYAESFVVNFATKQIAGDVSEYAIKAINYYVDQSGTSEYVPGQALTQIVDPLAAQLLALSQQPAVDSLLKSLPMALQSPVLQADTTVSLGTKAALEGLAAQIPALQQLLLDVDRTASRSNVNPLYTSTKEYLCCSLSSDSSDLYDAWVATGALSLTLVILTTLRLVTFVREWYPKGM